MVDIGDELTIQSYKIPWLIWIQLIVLFLLFALLFFFALFPFDSDDHTVTVTVTATAAATVTASTSSDDNIQQIDKPLADRSSTSTVLTTRQHRTLQGGQNQSIKGEIATGPSMRREEILEEEASSLYFHPCHYFQLATVAFLKCFGLDSTSDRPSTRKHRKRKEL